MKITNVETMICDAGWRPWTFVKIQTDDGLTGYGECSDNRTPHAIVGCVEDLKPLPAGPGPTPHREALLGHVPRHAPESGRYRGEGDGGHRLRPVGYQSQSAGGPGVRTVWRTRPATRYVCIGRTAGRHGRATAKSLGTPPLRTLDDIANLGQEVVSRGFTALKTNIVIPGEPAQVFMQGFGGGPGTTDQAVTTAIIRAIENLIGTFRRAVGPDVDICLDLNFNFKTEACLRIAKALKPFNLLWLEIDMYDPDALLQIKQSTTTRICSGENLYTLRGYRPYFEKHALDVAMIDVPWNGFTQSKKVG